MTAPKHPGLQPERTELAWRRTLLALGAGALVSVRVLPDVLGDWTIATGVAGVAVATVLWAVAGRRHAVVAAVFARRSPAARMPGGALLLAAALLTAAGAALGLLYAVLPHR